MRMSIYPDNQGHSGLISLIILYKQMKTCDKFVDPSSYLISTGALRIP